MVLEVTELAKPFLAGLALEQPPETSRILADEPDYIVAFVLSDFAACL